MDVKIFRPDRKNKRHLSGFVFEIRKHILTIILFFVLLTGLISGNFMLSINDNISGSVSQIFSSYITSSAGQTFRKCFVQNLTVNTVTVLINFIFGLCAVGLPVPIMNLFIKGFGIGVLSKYLYFTFGLKGFGYCMIVIYPIQIAVSLILLKASKESVSMSISIFRALTNNDKNCDKASELQKYLVKFIIMFFVISIISVIESLFTIYITKYFNF